MLMEILWLGLAKWRPLVASRWMSSGLPVEGTLQGVWMAYGQPSGDAEIQLTLSFRHYLLFVMNQIVKILVVLLLAAIVSSQTVNLDQIFTPETLATLGPEYQNPEFLKTINNYFGCKTWQNGVCTECSASYIFNNNGVCCKIDQNCAVFNRAQGVCERCYTGYHIDANGTCTASAPTDSAVVGCAEWQDNTCVKCSAKFYRDSNNVCVPVSDQCREWNVDTGACSSCYTGYTLNNGQCVRDAAFGSNPSNPNCKVFTNGQCNQCPFRAYFDANGICQFVDGQCQTWDLQDGHCLTCYNGYNLDNGACVQAPLADPSVSDVGCKVWEGSVCLECSLRWVFNAQGVCIPVSDICRTWDNNGQCLTCYQGYNLQNGQCEFVPNTQSPPDQGCAEWDWANLVCQKCSNNWVSVNGVCVAVSDQCRTHDASGACTACYRGYAVDNGQCVLAPAMPAAPAMLGCKIWNWDTQVCQECSKYWHFNADGVCVPVSDLCATYDPANGQCLTCFGGYQINQGICALVPPQEVADQGCRSFSNGACVECSQNWVFNANNVCIPVSAQCMTHDLSNGWCTSCYRGYALQNVLDANNNVVNVTCDVISNIDAAAVIDIGCKTFENGVCVECSKFWYFNADGVCLPVSDLCATFDATNGHCLSCYNGYNLNVDTGACDLAAPLAPSDLGCRTFENGVCVECSRYWVFNSAGVCVPVSDLCKEYDAANGQCTSCFNGFVLNNGACELGPNNGLGPLFPSDAGCKEWDWANQKCLTCSNFWFFNADGICAPVNDLCKTYDNANGHCLSCYKGYNLNVDTGACDLAPGKTVSDVGCAEWNWDQGVCLRCSEFWYSNNGVCTAVSPYCKTHDNTNGQCLTCYQGYSLNNGACELAANNFCRTSDANGCLTCYNGFVLYQGQCVTLSSISNIALYYAECCPEKLAQLRAEGRIPM